MHEENFDIIKISGVTGYYCYLKVPDKVDLLCAQFHMKLQLMTDELRQFNTQFNTHGEYDDIVLGPGEKSCLSHVL